MTIGIRMLLSTWTPITRALRQALGAGELDVVLQHRLARARAREPDQQRELEQREVDRRHDAGAASRRARGRTPGTSPNSCVVGPRPFDGSQPSITEKTMISISPTQNVGQREAEDRAGHDRPAGDAVRPQARPHAERNAEHDRDQHRGERELQRRRHPLEDQCERRRAVHERAAEIAAQRAGEEDAVLLPAAACRGRAPRSRARDRSGRPAG